MFLKRLACLVLALTVSVQPLIAQAVDLGKAFDGLAGSAGGAVAINDPGRFSSGARNGFSGGGFEMRMPRAGNVQLVSASAPKISAGCNGISAHFGGFSFISGEEFGQLLRQIASGAALGFVSSMVMKSLCPMCEAVVQELKSAAQAAARMARDSCEIGRQFGQQFNLFGGTKENVPETCSQVVAGGGNQSGDYLGAFSTICKGLQASTRAINSWNPVSGNTEKDRAASADRRNCETGAGNVTWRRLKSFDSSGIYGAVATDDYRRKLILLNLLGADLQYAEGKTVGCQLLGTEPWTAAAEGPDAQKYCPPQMDMQAYVGLFLCGAAGVPPGTSKSAKKYCDSLRPGGAEPQAWVCGDNNNECNFLKLAPASEVFTGDGFFIQINKLLLSAVRRVRDGTGYTDDEGKLIISLINAAPYPLYQAINAAAVYPAAATELLDTMSVLVAEQYTHAVFDEMLRLEGRSASALCVSREQSMQVLDFVSKLRSQNQARLSLIAQNFNLQQGLTEQIRQINIAIQRQVMSEDMLATGRLSEALNRALTTSNAGAGRPVTSTSTTTTPAAPEPAP